MAIEFYSGYFVLGGLAVLFLIAIPIILIIKRFVYGDRLFRVVCLLFFMIVIAGITLYARMELRYSSRKACSEEVIESLHSFYNKTNQYPHDIEALELDKDINSKFIKREHYIPSPSGQSFKITFNTYKEITYSFDSEHNNWTSNPFIF